MSGLSMVPLNAASTYLATFLQCSRLYFQEYKFPCVIAEATSCSSSSRVGIFHLFPVNLEYT